MTQQVTQGKIIHTQYLNSEILQAILLPEHYIDYSAGQYLQLLHPDYKNLFYSIANASNGQTYELHIRENIPLTQILLKQKQLTITLPYGECTWEKLGLNTPILLIAGGTGFAPIHAILEQIFSAQQIRPITLIWVVRTTEDLYYHQQLLNLQCRYSFFKYYACISSQFTLSQFMTQHNLPQLIQSHVVLAGPFNMVYALRDELVKLSVPIKQIHSDAFSFEGE